MPESYLINLSVIALLLPLFGFTTVIIFGKRFQKLFLFETGVISLAFIITIVIGFFKLVYFTSINISHSFTWIHFPNVPLFGSFTIDMGIKIDNITVIMLFVVNLISLLVHIYSIEYMKGDKRYNRYFAYLGIFTFSMLGIVLADNILMMYIFWELVGLSSYLLIGFWFEKKSASDAGKKAFIVNRIGDIGMFAGILIIFANFHTFNFDSVYSQIASGTMPFESTAWLTAAGILLFMGAVGKSAQFPLHVWLPDAMEGPTPVSALIHAATMVAAGVYLSLRIFAILTADAMLVVALVGAFTSFIAATIALTQTDIKKVLAYSTVSQLGYMIMAVGTGAYAYAFFHLVTHAFFKACLFLGSGSVIHAMHHEQDITKMGGLRKKMPLTYYTFLISTLAISGVPLTSGFLSKDGILAGTIAFGELTGHWMIPLIAFTVAMLTAFYMFRLVILTFHGSTRDEHKFEHAHESPMLMTVPLIILALLSVFVFYTPNPIAASEGKFISEWIKTPATVVPNIVRFDFMKTSENTNDATVIHSVKYTEAMHHAHYPAMFLSLAVAGIGIFAAFVFYQWKKLDSDKLVSQMAPFYKFSLNKWYLDELYEYLFVNNLLRVSSLMNLFDARVVDGAVNGSARLTKMFSNITGLFDNYVVDGFVNAVAFLSGTAGLILRKLQSGRIQSYLVLIITSVIILWLFFNPFK